MNSIIHLVFYTTVSHPFEHFHLNQASSSVGCQPHDKTPDSKKQNSARFKKKVPNQHKDETKRQ